MTSDASDASDTGADWAAKRRDAAAEQAAAFDRKREAESAKARELIGGFVAEARGRGLRTMPLRARSFDGRTTYKTPLIGWYLKRNGSLAVDEAGRFYVMSAETSLRARFTGAVVDPSDPPLTVGVGGRDGESMPLDHLLALRLEAGDEWPGPS